MANQAAVTEAAMATAYSEALHEVFFRPSGMNTMYHPGEMDAIRRLYPELGGYVTLPRVLAVVAQFGDRRCANGSTQDQRQEQAKMHSSRLQALYGHTGYGCIGRMHGAANGEPWPSVDYAGMKRYQIIRMGDGRTRQWHYDRATGNWRRSVGRWDGEFTATREEANALFRAVMSNFRPTNNTTTPELHVSE